MNVQRTSRRAPRAASLALAAAFFCAAMASAQIRTVLVSPVPGDPGSSGANLLSALAGIPAPSATNPWLLKIEPGIYDVKSTPLQMRPWVDIEGSGIGVTTIRGTVDPTIDLNYGTVMGADNSELRDLTVEAVGSAINSTVIPMVNSTGSPRVSRVKLYGRSATFANYGMRNISSAPLLEEVEIYAIGGSYAYGIVSVGVSSRRGEVRRSRITAENASSSNYGLFFSTGVITKEIRDSEITVRGGSSAYGLYFLNIVDSLPEPISFDHVEIDTLNGSANNYGIYGTSSYVPLQLFACDVQVSGSGSRYGIRQEYGPTNVLNSTVSAPSGIILSLGPVVVGNSRLLGGPVTGSSPRCLGVHDEANLFYTGACPP